MKSMSKAFPELLAASLLFLLAACQSPESPPKALSYPRLPPARPGAPAEPGTPSMAPSPPPTMAELAADPMRFKGMSGGDVTALLGKPSFQRKDADAEIWQYYGPASACVLDLFLYPDQAATKVAHAELRSRSSGSAGICLKQILDGQRG